MSTATTIRPAATEPLLGQTPLTHIVRPSHPDRSAITEVMEARLFGNEVEALCGYVWVPSRDPKKHPLCQVCKDIYDLAGDLGDAPKGFDPEALPS